MTRYPIRTMVIAFMVVSLAVPAFAENVAVLGFEDESWDGEADEDGSWLPAIESLREVHPELVDVRTLDLTRTRRSRGFLGSGLQITIPDGGYRGFGPYSRLSEPVDEAWFRYHIRLEGFRPVSSGKLPGLADASRTSNAKGCKPSTEDDPGWSARMMFDAVGTKGAAPGEVPIGYYLYHLAQTGTCGDEYIFDVGLEQNRWTCVEGHVRMNEPGLANGALTAWIDGDKVFQKQGIEYRRKSEPEIGVRELWNNVYFGGRYPTPNQLTLVYDQMVVSDRGRIGCLDPFVDDNTTVHEASLTELHARGLLYGCEERKACPFEPLTRAQFAALIHRLYRPPAGPDAFVDDDGHWAEGVLDSLAAAGILQGCDPPANRRVCPDDPITRAQVAAVVQRTLGLPDGPNAFSDDDGHWAEKPINALAAAGITRGCDEARYCPDRSMSRMEAATFTVRIDDMLKATLAPLAAPDLPDWPPPGPPPVKPPEERE